MSTGRRSSQQSDCNSAHTHCACTLRRTSSRTYGSMASREGFCSGGRGLRFRDQSGRPSPGAAGGGREAVIMQA